MKVIETLTLEQNQQLALMLKMTAAISTRFSEFESTEQQMIETLVLSGISGLIGLGSNTEIHNQTIRSGALFRIYDEVMSLVKERIEAAIFEATPLDTSTEISTISSLETRAG